MVSITRCKVQPGKWYMHRSIPGASRESLYDIQCHDSLRTNGPPARGSISLVYKVTNIYSGAPLVFTSAANTINAQQNITAPILQVFTYCKLGRLRTLRASYSYKL